MKKIISKLGWLSLIFAQPVAAVIPSPTPPTGVPTSSLSTMITTISNTILAIVGVVAVLFLILGGFQYITSAGNPEQIGKAKNTVLYAIIGIIVAILAYVIVNFVITKLA